jgi:coenzyme A diphosphatase NUDT7
VNVIVVKGAEHPFLFFIKTKFPDAGDTALPGGKADSLSEPPYQTARREAFEEIGLPLQSSISPLSSRIVHLCQLPISIAPTWLGVRPCVAWIQHDPSLMIDATNDSSGMDSSFVPELDANEVAAVFTVPLKSFLKTSFPAHMASHISKQSQPWYKGDRFPFDNGTVRMYNFYMPITSSSVKWTGSVLDACQTDEMTFRIFGLTAKILVETARIAFDREPQFEHDENIGDEDLISRYILEGKMGDKMKSDTRDEGTIRARNNEANKKAEAKM